MSKNIKTVSIAIIAIVVLFLFIYSCYWTAKTISYAIFYKSLVKQTVIEMVNIEALKN